MRSKVWDEIDNQDLSASQLAHAFTVPTNPTNTLFNLREVLVHFSTSVSLTVIVKKKPSKGGANYETILDSTALSSGTDYVFRPTPGSPVKEGDIITVSTTGGSTGIAYSTIYLD